MKVKRKKTKSADSYLENPPHDGLLPPMEDLDKVKEKRAASCTALTSTSPPESPEKRGEANSLVPVEEGKPTTLDMLKRKRMKMSGRHLPLVHCNICRFAQTCPQHKPGYECGFTNNILKSIGDMSDAKEFMKYLAEVDLSRAQQAVIFEQLSGGALEENTSLALTSAFDKLRVLIEMEEHPEEAVKESSILEALFGRVLRQAKPVHTENDSIDITDEVTQKEEDK